MAEYRRFLLAVNFNHACGLSSLHGSLSHEETRDFDAEIQRPLQ
jgi:hypothetical protein